jgi:hypothetical protein
MSCIGYKACDSLGGASRLKKKSWQKKSCINSATPVMMPTEFVGDDPASARKQEESEDADIETIMH